MASSTHTSGCQDRQDSPVAISQLWAHQPIRGRILSAYVTIIRRLRIPCNYGLTLSTCSAARHEPCGPVQRFTHWLFGANVTSRVHHDLWDATTIVLRSALRQCVRDGPPRA